jgi:hypothetical protein
MTSKPTDEVDALIAAIDPGLGSGPGIRMRDVILVTGPWLAGSTSLIAALAARLPERTFVDTSDLAHDEAPAAVVFVTSAVAPLTESDCGLLDTAAANTDLVIGAVSKIDVHHSWRDVLASDRAAVAAHDPRYSGIDWVGVAAAPQLGQPRLDELVNALERGLTHSQLPRRNRLRVWQNRLRHVVSRHEDAAAGLGHEARISALRQERSDALRHRRLAKSERTIELRSRLQQARVQLAYFARSRCSSVRGELAEDAGAMNRRRLPEFEQYVARRLGEVATDVNDGVSTQLCDLAAEFGLDAPAEGTRPLSPLVTRAPLAPGGLEGRLMMLLGAVLGIGVALTLSRVFVDLAPAYTVAGLVAGAVMGLVVAVWVVAMRRTLRDRAVLERWVSETAGELRAVVEQHVTTRVLDAESALITQQAHRDEAEAALVADRVATIDDELREHTAAATAASARRDREVPSLQRALDAVHAELDGNSTEKDSN